MALMDFIRKISGNRSEKTKKFKEMEEDLRLQKILGNRQKSPNERELDRIQNEDREELITEELEKRRKVQRKDNWKGNNIFKGHKSILHEDRKALANDRPILKQKNIFANQDNIFANNKNMFMQSKMAGDMMGDGMFFK